MMRKTIMRTLTTSIVNGYRVVIVDGQPKIEEIEPLTVMGKVTEKQAQKALKRKYGKEISITISSISTQEHTYEISVEDFVKYATKLPKASDTSETATTN